MLQRGNRRRRRVSAISDYLESTKKGKTEGGAAPRKAERRGCGERGKKGKKESELWIAGGTASNSSNCASDFLQSQHMAD